MPKDVQRRRPKDVLLSNPYCAPLRHMYDGVEAGSASSWEHIEDAFLEAIAAFDAGLPRILAPGEAREKMSSQLSAALQNGKGDWFNNLLALLLERCAAVEGLYRRTAVPGLIIAKHNLDAVYPGDPTREPEFLLEAKMMGTPKHAISPEEKAVGRGGSRDAGKRVKELAFKAIDLKGEARRRLARSRRPLKSATGGGDLSAWLHENPPRIYFFMAVRVLGDADFAATLRWAETAAQVVDGVGVFCYEAHPFDLGAYRPRRDVPTVYELAKVLHRACQELQSLHESPPPPIPLDGDPSPALEAEALGARAADEP
jgi:hypothetical protein